MFARRFSSDFSKFVIKTSTESVSKQQQQQQPSAVDLMLRNRARIDLDAVYNNSSRLPIQDIVNHLDKAKLHGNGLPDTIKRALSYYNSTEHGDNPSGGSAEEVELVWVDNLKDYREKQSATVKST